MHDEFVDRSSSGPAGSGWAALDANVETGPLTGGDTATRSRSTSPRARRGAVLRCGGRRPDDPALADGHYYLPTVLDDYPVT